MTWIHQRKRNPKGGLKRENQRKRLIKGHGKTLFIYFFLLNKKTFPLNTTNIFQLNLIHQKREGVIVRNLKDLQLESKFG
jgi:hypothetical protein